jgi:hypothetical protein
MPPRARFLSLFLDAPVAPFGGELDGARGEGRGQKHRNVVWKCSRGRIRSALLSLILRFTLPVFAALYFPAALAATQSHSRASSGAQLVARARRVIVRVHVAVEPLAWQGARTHEARGADAG